MKKVVQRVLLVTLSLVFLVGAIVPISAGETEDDRHLEYMEKRSEQFLKLGHGPIVGIRFLEDGVIHYYFEDGSLMKSTPGEAFIFDECHYISGPSVNSILVEERNFFAMGANIPGSIFVSRFQGNNFFSGNIPRVHIQPVYSVNTGQQVGAWVTFRGNIPYTGSLRSDYEVEIEVTDFDE